MTLKERINSKLKYWTNQYFLIFLYLSTFHSLYYFCRGISIVIACFKYDFWITFPEGVCLILGNGVMIIYIIFLAYIGRDSK